MNDRLTVCNNNLTPPHPNPHDDADLIACQAILLARNSCVDGSDIAMNVDVLSATRIDWDNSGGAM